MSKIAHSKSYFKTWLKAPALQMHLSCPSYTRSKQTRTVSFKNVKYSYMYALNRHYFHQAYITIQDLHCNNSLGNSQKYMPLLPFQVKLTQKLLSIFSSGLGRIMFSNSLEIYNFIYCSIILLSLTSSQAPSPYFYQMKKKVKHILPQTLGIVGRAVRIMSNQS